jgi:hypothetical protein
MGGYVDRKRDKRSHRTGTCRHTLDGEARMERARGTRRLLPDRSGERIAQHDRVVAVGTGRDEGQVAAG